MEKVILIVDDSPTLRASLSFCLKNAGYNVIEAINGIDGLEKIKEKGGAISLIILDIIMPKMDGITFLKEVRKTLFRFIPVLILSTVLDERKRREARLAGAAGWLTKPFKPEQLLWVVKKFVR